MNHKHLRILYAALVQLHEYSMEFNLCGHGEATVSILPGDPREKELF